MAALIGAPDLIGGHPLADEPDLVSRTTALATEKPGLAAPTGTPPTPQPLSFGSSTIANQSWTVGTAVSLTLPQATGGTGTVTYTLTPSLPTGITRSGRTLAGTPSAAFTSATFTWSATDGTDTVTLTFTVAVAATVPGVPRNLTATAGDGEVDLSWMAPTSNGGSAITGYQYRVDSGSWVDVTGTSATVTGLTNGTAYSFTVRAVNSVGNSAATSAVSATPMAATTPLSFGASTIANQSWTFGTAVALTLPEATGGSGTITYALSPALPAGVTRTNRAIAGTPSTAAASATYTWTATAGSETVSLTFTIVVAAIVPGVPRNLTATAGDGQVALSWDAPTSNGGSAITGYEYRVDTGSWTAATGTSATITGLTNGTAYSFAVRAVNAIGTGTATSAVSATPAAATPATPVTLPTNLPSGWFVVPELTGEVGRMWVQVGPNDNNYVWGESPRPVVGQAYRNTGTAVLDDDMTINAIRIPGATTLRLHASAGFFSTHIAANDGDGSEPNRSLYIYASATEFDEFRYDGITNAGGGFVNWTLDTGDKVLLRGELDTDGSRFILIVADAS